MTPRHLDGKKFNFDVEESERGRAHMEALALALKTRSVEDAQAIARMSQTWPSGSVHGFFNKKKKKAVSDSLMPEEKSDEKPEKKRIKKEESSTVESSQARQAELEADFLSWPGSPAKVNEESSRCCRMN